MKLISYIFFFINSYKALLHVRKKLMPLLMNQVDIQGYNKPNLNLSDRVSLALDVLNSPKLTKTHFKALVYKVRRDFDPDIEKKNIEVYEETLNSL